MDPDPGMDSTDPVRAAAAVRDPARLRAVATVDEATVDAWCDDLVVSARAQLGTSAALVSIVERHGQRFPGACGLPPPWQRRRAAPLTHSFCQYVVGSRRPLVITDARRHPVLHDNAAIDDLGVVAYAGAPIVTDAGHVLGAFCAIDSVPRSWTGTELRQIAAYAARCGQRFSRPQPTDPGRPARPPVRQPSLTDTGPADHTPPSGRTAPLDPATLVPGFRIDGRPPIRMSRDEVVFGGRFHAEAATIKIRITDTAEARARFAHRIQVYAAFGPTPPPVVAGAYRWSDNDRFLILSGGPGTMLQTREEPDRALTSTHLRAVVAAAAQLSTWRPGREDAQMWQIDHHRMIDERHRAHTITDDEARRLHDLAQWCEPVRMFAHGALTMHCVKQLPSGRLTFTGFDRAGMYLPARDLATLYVTLPHDDHAGHQHILHRVIDVDALEPFTVNLFLAATPTANVLAGTTAAGRAAHWATFWHARNLAHRLLHRLTAD
ncbi:GAF domain-containing protein [Dactylosporangium sp. NPDC049525]|uniref:GAF domain-containing protein n=1 Tax=Dactylosporangium sp. NPDC049525 TaxID=3154730 RepID=UPI003442A867